MKKLKAIWNLLISDKWAVFTYENAPENPEWMTAPKFKWRISSNDDYFINLILYKITAILKVNKKSSN